MKLLLDTCISRKVVQELQSAGHDVEHTGEWPSDPGDTQILAYAHRQGRTLVTLDKDFGELAIVQRIVHTGIIRLVNTPTNQQAAVCIEVLKRYGEDLQTGAIVTAELGYAKIRPPDSK